ncbi:MAG: hypothetical protein RR555_06150 [Bacteroidales bacterium]
MKKNLLKSLSLALLSLMIVACSNPSKMAKFASQVTTECNPQVLEAKAGKISATYTVKFPAKYFVKKAILNITPVLVYEGGEVAGPILSLQGEKVLDNNAVISYANGGTASKEVVFNYVPGMEKATLELRATVTNDKKTKSYAYPVPFKIADGTNCTYMLACTHGTPSFEADNYQKIIKEKEESQVLYLINSAEVRKNQLKTSEIKEFEEFLKKTKADERRTITSNDIVAYASPDGVFDKNATLAEKRASTAKTAFVKTITKKVDVKDIPLNVNQISEDWEGFQELVSQSDIQDKDLIIRVLSMYSDPNVREREIRNMSNVFQTLATKVLPALRRARFIANVEYKNWTDAELTQIIDDNIDQLDEEALLYGATLFDKDDAKANIYKKAADKFNSSRAYNNLAALNLKAGKTADAKANLAKMSNKTTSYYNNMGAAALQEKDLAKAAEYLAKSDLKEAKYNMGAIDILNGNYSQAVSDLNGSGSCNEALASILTNNLAKASTILKDKKCPNSAYLSAIVAARNGNASEAKAQLEIAKKNATLAARSAKDIEFAKL